MAAHRRGRPRRAAWTDQLAFLSLCAPFSKIDGSPSSQVMVILYFLIFQPSGVRTKS